MVANELQRQSQRLVPHVQLNIRDHPVLIQTNQLMVMPRQRVHKNASEKPHFRYFQISVNSTGSHKIPRRTAAFSPWYIALDHDRWPWDDRRMLDRLKGLWQEPYGDRRQEIVLIGRNLEEDRIRKLLGDALLTDDEFQAGPRAWTELPDPLPSWQVPNAANRSASDSTTPATSSLAPRSSCLALKICLAPAVVAFCLVLGEAEAGSAGKQPAEEYPSLASKRRRGGD